MVTRCRTGAGTWVGTWRSSTVRTRAFAEIGDAPSVTVVVVAMVPFLVVASATRIVAAEPPTLGIREAALFLLLPLVAIGWPFVVSALYRFVFDVFDAEAQYRVILSVTLHAMWGVLVFGAVSALLWRLVSGEPPLEVREFLVSSAEPDERIWTRSGPGAQPARDRLAWCSQQLGFAIAQPVSRWMSFAVVFGGWFELQLATPGSAPALLRTSGSVAAET